METNKTIIFHNTRCSKSRCALEVLEEHHENFEIIDYTKGITKDQLVEVIRLLKIHPEELIRKNESTFKENYKDKAFTNDEWIDIMVEHPILIERPIVIKNGKAVIGRPVEKVIELIEKN